MQSINTAYLYTTLTILFWAGSASAFKLALKEVSPLTLLWSSTLISLMVLSVLLKTGDRFARLKNLTRVQWLYLLALGAINPFLYYLILFKAYDLLPGQVAMSLNYLWPVMLAIFSVPILKQSLEWKALLGICLSFIGAAIIASGGNLAAWSQLNITGIFLALTSTLVWAVYWLLSARLKVDAVVKLFIGFVTGSLLSLLYAIFNNQIVIEFETFPWIPILYVGLFEMGLTFFIWLRALEIAPNAARIGHLIFLTPFLSLMILVIVLNESISLSTIVGLVVIIAGIFSKQLISKFIKSS